MENYTPQFLEGYENAKLCMSHPMFGYCPYGNGTNNNLEWTAGFEHAFTIGKL